MSKPYRTAGEISRTRGQEEGSVQDAGPFVSSLGAGEKPISAGVGLPWVPRYLLLVALSLLAGMLLGLLYGLLRPTPWPAAGELPKTLSPQVRWRGSWGEDALLARAWVEALAASMQVEEAWVGQVPPELASLLPQGVGVYGGWRRTHVREAWAWLSFPLIGPAWEQLQARLRQAGWYAPWGLPQQSLLAELVQRLEPLPQRPWTRVYCRGDARLDLEARREGGRVQLTLRYYQGRAAWPCSPSFFQDEVVELIRDLALDRSVDLPQFSPPPGARMQSLVPSVQAQGINLAWLVLPAAGEGEDPNGQLVRVYTQQLRRAGWQPLEEHVGQGAYLGRWRGPRGQTVQLVLLPFTRGRFLLGLAREAHQLPSWSSLYAGPSWVRGEVTSAAARAWVQRYLNHHLQPQDTLTLVVGQKPELPLPPAWKALGWWEVQRTPRYGGVRTRTWLLWVRHAPDPEQWMAELVAQGWQVQRPPSPPGLRVKQAGEPLAFLCSPQREVFSLQQWPAQQGLWLYLSQSQEPALVPACPPPAVSPDPVAWPRLELPAQLPVHPGPWLESGFFQASVWVPQEHMDQVRRLLEEQLRSQGWQRDQYHVLAGFQWSVWFPALPQGEPVVLLFWPLRPEAVLVLLLPWLA